MNIILLGYRGSGKTSVGKLVAAGLGLSFVDVDVETCKRFGNLTIAQIWKQHGEPAWRAREVEVTQQLLAGSNQVIGLGGGTVMQPAARQAIEQAGDALRVYLQATADELYRRVSQDSQSSAMRPNLTQLGQAGAAGGGIEEIQHVLAQRESTYRAVADHVLDVTQLSVQAAAEQIIALARQTKR